MRPTQFIREEFEHRTYHQLCSCHGRLFTYSNSSCQSWCWMWQYANMALIRARMERPQQLGIDSICRQPGPGSCTLTGCVDMIPGILSNAALPGATLIGHRTDWRTPALHAQTGTSTLLTPLLRDLQLRRRSCRGWEWRIHWLAFRMSATGLLSSARWVLCS